MEELTMHIRRRIKEERYRIFRWMARSMNLSTRFMVPDESSREDLGKDGAVTSGPDALRRSAQEYREVSRK